MQTCLFPGARVWVSESADPKRKLKYTWQLLDAPDGRVLVNPSLANELVAEALEQGRLEPLTGYSTLRREVRYGDNSRVDFLLENGSSRCFVEVKQVTLLCDSARAAFPDSVTERGTRHLRELMQRRAAGDRAVLLFSVARESASSVEPADAIDPVYGATLREAIAAGVEVLAYRCRFTAQDVHLAEPLPLILPPLDAGMPQSVSKMRRRH